MIKYFKDSYYGFEWYFRIDTEEVKRYDLLILLKDSKLFNVYKNGLLLSNALEEITVEEFEKVHKGGVEDV